MSITLVKITTDRRGNTIEQVYRKVERKVEKGEERLYISAESYLPAHMLNRDILCTYGHTIHWRIKYETPELGDNVQ
ncbi:hypothetical protein G646_gp067 [Serratia phage phiMAM1]|uniref:Uncharacterized protein n=1 Tax=Serratia phage phiMAM1 TaxID=1262513 RepID=K7YXV8_9CAUD|nr:hypothetical protein G646_gp067 [Serratia phage phiMAM1]AFX93535.1 hypothetical protein MAM_067 [Serratia phage phiMAM1]